MRPINSSQNPTSKEIADLILAGRLDAVLRGETAVYITPEEINDDMRPTDHVELLVKGIYPLAPQLGTEAIKNCLETALAKICVDARGVYCAHTCYYIQLIKERWNHSPIAIDRIELPRKLGQAFLDHAAELHHFEVKPGDAKVDASYLVVLSGMEILAKDHGIDWGIPLPTLNVAPRS